MHKKNVSKTNSFSFENNFKMFYILLKQQRKQYGLNSYHKWPVGFP